MTNERTTFTRPQKAYIDNVIGDVCEEMFGFRLPPLETTRWDYARKPSRLNMRFASRLSSAAESENNRQKKLEAKATKAL
mgnify:CR=1 FL=1